MFRVLILFFFFLSFFCEEKTDTIFTWSALETTQNTHSLLKRALGNNAFTTKRALSAKELRDHHRRACNDAR